MLRAWRDQPRPGHGTDLMWTPCGPQVVGSSPLRVECPTCNASIGQHCTRAVPRRGNIRRTAPHDARIASAEGSAAAEGDAHTTEGPQLAGV